MMKITKESVTAQHAKTPRRKCFYGNSEVQKRKEKPTFSVSIESAKKVFESQTGLQLSYNPNYDKYWKYVDSNEIDIIEAWEKDQGNMIYLRDCLSLSVALDTNLTDNSSGMYTCIGALEHNGKTNKDCNAVIQLARIVADKIKHLPYYKDADYICSVPPRPDKDFDLPSSVVSLVSQKIGKPDITSGFKFGGQKSSVKASSFEEKWRVWEDAHLSFSCNVKNKTVVLIDDKYQSGITIQYIAMKLQEAGVQQIYGLSFVKTLRDTDNV